MKADAVIFDKDGTLLDFDAFWVSVSVKAIGLFLERIGMDGELCDEILEAYGVDNGITSINGVLCKGTYAQMGQIAHEVLSKYGFAGSVEEVTKLLVSAYSESSDAGVISLTCPNLADTLAELKGRGKKLAVVTTDNKEMTVKCLKALGIDAFFDKIYTDDGVTPTKPDPFCVYDICNTLGIEKERVVMVGDTETDVKFARNAGIRVIGVAKGDVNKKILGGMADTVLSDVSELIGVIE
jgi:HAD superfamily hydrolase (TIGR01549 family)